MTLKVDRIENQAGSAGIPTDTVIEGSAKAWVNFNGTGTIAVRDSFNVASIVDNGTGQFTVNVSSAFANTDYAFTLGVNPTDGSFRASVGQNTFTVSSYNIGVKNVSGTDVDEEYVVGVTYGDLA